MKLLTTLCFISGIVFVHLNVIAADRPCGNKVIDLKKFPGVKSEKDISRNQDSVQWCESFCYADLFCYHYNKKSNWSIKDQCSAADLRAKFAPQNRTLNDVARLGWLENLSKEEFTQGICPESIFPSEYWNNQQISTSNLYAALEKASQKIKTEGRASVEGMCPECAAISPKTDWQNVMNHLEKASDGKDFLTSVNEVVCKDRRIGQGIKIKFNDEKIRKSKSMKYENEILDQLDNGNPVSVGIESSFLSSKVKGGHAVLAIGTIEMLNSRGDKTCFVAIKNSWGNSCEYVTINRYTQCDSKTGLVYMDRDAFIGRTSNPEWIID
ncbi:MAG: hypothetical protein BroJett041_23530 [Candidatus Jettenia caeni]|nr:MAG: hypothetical protein BroJett041_23530 [Candidatus Jettenia caeni]